jgi:hypothetical protein
VLVSISGTCSFIQTHPCDLPYEQDGKERTMDGGDAKNSFPLDAMNKLKKAGAKKVQTFGPNELKKK